MAEVIHHEGMDYWRTWFLEECETNKLFGVVSFGTIVEGDGEGEGQPNMSGQDVTYVSDPGYFRL